jgi:hypothetical protein
MVELLRQFLSFLEHFLVVELLVVSAFEVQHPTLDFVRLTMNDQQFVKFVQHPKMFSPKSSLNWQNSMTIPRNFFALFMHVLHNLVDDSARINLLIDGVDLDKTHTLHMAMLTFTLVSIWNSNRLSARFV